MTFSDRLELFKQLENLRGRPLIVYVTSARRPLSAQETDEDDKFFLGFAGSAVFPYDPNPLAGLGLARLMALCSKLEIPV